MTTLTNERRAYCPIVVTQDPLTGADVLALDTLRASYVDLRTQPITCSSFQVTDSEAGTPDAIAYKFYGDEKLWWLICVFNGIVDPYEEIATGVKLLIPKLDEVTAYLTSDTTYTSVSTVNRVGSSGEI
jgi:hypothetical protein